MKNTILYTSFNSENVEDKKTLYRLMNAKESGRVIDLAGQTITMEDFVIFERASDGDVTVVMAFLKDGELFGTISRSFIDVFTNFLDAGFLPEMAKTVKIGTAKSKKGREFLTAEII